MEHIGEILARQTGESVPVSEDLLEETDFRCPICKDTGFVHPLLEPGHPDYGRTVPCQCRAEELARRRKERMMAQCQLPADTQDMTFDNFKVSPGLEEALESAKAMARGDLRWLTLLARVDRGKTHLAVAICRDRMARGEPARYIYVPLLLDLLRSGYSDDTYQVKMQQFLDIPLLVLDDLGVTKQPSPWSMEKLNTIIDYRYINGMDLVVTSNCELDAIPGDDECRIGSRLLRVRQGKVVAINTPEYRMVNEE